MSQECLYNPYDLPLSTFIVSLSHVFTNNTYEAFVHGYNWIFESPSDLVSYRIVFWDDKKCKSYMVTNS